LDGYSLLTIVVVLAATLWLLLRADKKS